MKSFKELEAWKKCRELRKDISQLTKKSPAEEKYKLVDQMIRASRSVTANIAEGYGRYHYQEYVQFCCTSRGSLTELQDHLTVAIDESYISREELDGFNQRIEECIKLINGFIKYLLNAKKHNS